MTEQEWLECEEPLRILMTLRSQGKASDRRLRLLAVAACHSLDLSVDERIRVAVAVAEEYGEGLTGTSELARARDAALTIFYEQRLWLEMSRKVAVEAAISATALRPFTSAKQALSFAMAVRRNYVKYLLAELFRNPFRPIAPNPAWLTSTVRGLAESIYTDRAFDRLPILADALEDAGCDVQDILIHLRQPGEHCRGCWWLDLVVGKE